MVSHTAMPRTQSVQLTAARLLEGIAAPYLHIGAILISEVEIAQLKSGGVAANVMLLFMYVPVGCHHT